MLSAISETSTRASWREDLVTMALVGWTIAGLFVDAYHHVTDPTLESFWTPWHAIFYSGYLATAGWMAAVVIRHRRNDGGLLEGLPLGYRTGVIGVGVFALGGMGDALWHEVLGVESSLDALLSPTHLLLWLGGLAIASTPLRAAWRDRGGGDDVTWRSFLPVLVSLAFVTALVAFFFQYAWVLADDGFPRQRYSPDRGFSETLAAFAVMGIILTTAILMAPIVLANRRWRLPFGTVTAVVAMANVLIAIGFDGDLVGIIPALVAGLGADVLIRLRAPRHAVAAVTPLVLWVGYFIAVARVGPIRWPPELWGGALVLAALTGLVLSAGVELLTASSAAGRDAPG